MITFGWASSACPLVLLAVEFGHLVLVGDFGRLLLGISACFINIVACFGQYCYICMHTTLMQVAATGQEILKGVDLVVKEGEVHAIMGKNGSGKSTLSKVLVGHPDYEVTAGEVSYKGQDLLEMEPEERSHAGLFLSFQVRKRRGSEVTVKAANAAFVQFTAVLRACCSLRLKFPASATQISSAWPATPAVRLLASPSWTPWSSMPT